jgi:hypothetical protein
MWKYRELSVKRIFNIDTDPATGETAKIILFINRKLLTSLCLIAYLSEIRFLNKKRNNDEA